mgnify:FL=1
MKRARDVDLALPSGHLWGTRKVNYYLSVLLLIFIAACDSANSQDISEEIELAISNGFMLVSVIEKYRIAEREYPETISELVPN